MKNHYFKFLFLLIILSSDFIYASTPKPSFKGVEFKSSTKVLCSTGQQIVYKNETDESKLDGVFTTSYIWTFEGGTPKTFLGKTPPAIIYNTVGVFKTTLVGQASNDKGEILGKREATEMIAVENPKIDLGPDKIICANSAVTLDAGAGFEKYRWTPENNNGKLGDKQQLIVNTNGVYKITASTYNQCQATDIIKITLEICTGIEENEFSSNIKSYPNPAKGILNLETNLPIASELKIVLVDAQGKESFQSIYFNVNKFQESIDVSTIAPGLYRINYFVNGVLSKSSNIVIQ